MRSRITTNAAPILLAVTTAAILLPVATGGTIFYRDLSQNFLPNRILARSLAAAGDSTGWNPYLGGGVPLAANPNALLLHPAFLLDRFLAPESGIALAIAINAAVGIAFFFLFLRRRGFSPESAAAGAAAFGLTGPMLSLTTLPNLIASIAWVPPAVYFLDRVRSGSAQWFPAAVACGAISLMFADPVAAIALIALAAVSVTSPERDRATASGSRASAGSSAGVSGGGGTLSLDAPNTPPSSLFALFLLLSFLAAMVALVPGWEAIRGSARGAGFASGEFGKWSLHPARLPELLLPGWLGDPTRMGPSNYWGASWVETGLPLLLSVTIGLPVLFLAALGGAQAIGHISKRATPALAHESFRRELLAGVLLTAGGLILAFGQHLPGYDSAIRSIPFASSFRYPEKFLILFIAGAGILVACGLSRLSRSGAGDDLQRGAGRGGMKLGIALLPMALAFATAASLGSGAVAALLSALFGRPATPEATRHVVASALSVTGMAALLGLVCLLCARGRIRRERLALVVLAIICGDLFLSAIGPKSAGGAGPVPWGMRLNPSAAAGFFDTAPAKAAYDPADDPGTTAAGWRTCRLDRPAGFAFRQPTDSIAWGFLWDRITLARSWPAAFRSETAFDRPTDRIQPAGAARAAEAVASETGDSLARRTRLWSIDSVRFVTSYTPLAHPLLVETGRFEGSSQPPLVRYEYLAAFPRARFVGQAEFVDPGEDGAAALARTLAPEFDPKTTIVIEGAAADVPQTVAQDDSKQHARGQMNGLERPASVAWHRLAAGRMRIEVTTVGAGWIALAENFDSGWDASIDGEDARVYRAYGFLSAVFVAPGRHVLDLRYEPRGTGPGRMALALSGALTIAGTLGLRKRAA